MRRSSPLVLGGAMALLACAAPASAATPTLQAMVGQKLVVSMDGTSPSASLLNRARDGRISGVLIHRWNFSSADGLRAIAAKLQAAAVAGGRPPLLIAVDQEGGPVKTVSWIPPTLSPERMGELNSTTTAEAQGRKTGDALRDLGINLDLAPVADVPGSTRSFIYRQGRAWSFDARRTTRLTSAFSIGLAKGHVAATMKHFPGLGLARRNTDEYVVRIRASEAALAPGIRPYRGAVAANVPLVMLSNAVYDAYDARNAADWSRAVANGLLRTQLGFKGVTITDSLTAAASTRGVSEGSVAVKAATAGVDLILVTGTEASSKLVWQSLLDAATAGRIPRAWLTASNTRIAALKHGL